MKKFTTILLTSLFLVACGGGEIDPIDDNIDITDNIGVTDETDNTDNTEDPTDNTDTPTYTMEDVQVHDSEEDCWTVIDNTVYDMTEWINEHPGGAGPIKNLCGVDSTEAFAKIHGDSESASAPLPGLELGALEL